MYDYYYITYIHFWFAIYNTFDNDINLIIDFAQIHTYLQKQRNKYSSPKKSSNPTYIYMLISKHLKTTK